jgi:hypothetical protein
MERALAIAPSTVNQTVSTSTPPHPSAPHIDIVTEPEQVAALANETEDHPHNISPRTTTTTTTNSVSVGSDEYVADTVPATAETQATTEPLIPKETKETTEPANEHTGGCGVVSASDHGTTGKQMSDGTSTQVKASTLDEEEEEEEDEENTSTCWVCYETSVMSSMVSPCRCKGTLEYVHTNCLLEWLDQSNNKQCSHCHYEYVIEEEYESSVHKCMDSPYIPYIVATVLLVCVFYLFHKLCRCIVSTFQKRTSVPTAPHVFSHSVMSMLRTALPAMHPSLSLVINGIDYSRLAPVGTLNFTMLFAEIELFAFLVAGLYYVGRMMYTAYRQPPESANHTDASVATEADETGGVGDDAHEGLAGNASTHPPGGTHTASENHTQDASTEDVPLCDVVDSYWNETTTGSSDTFSEESICVFPLDVLQTSFHSVHFFLKKSQMEIIKKKISIIEPN